MEMLFVCCIKKKVFFRRGGGVYMFLIYFLFICLICYNMEFRVFDINGCVSLLLFGYF